MTRSRSLIGALGVAFTLALTWYAVAITDAATRGNLIVTISDSPDPAPALSQVTYAINVKNDGTVKATNVVVTVPLPPGAQFVKCATSNRSPCTQSAGTVTATLGTMKAHAIFKVSLVLAMPPVRETSTITLSARANGDAVSDSTGYQTTTVLPSGIPVAYLPSGRESIVYCGDTLSSDLFGLDTTILLKTGLGCISSAVGLTVTASGKTVDLNKFKIVGATAKSNIGNVGIRILNAQNVTIIGRSTGGSSGIEYFDFGVKEDGGSSGLVVTQLRIFRARSAGVRTISDGVTLDHVLVDKTAPTTGATAVLPGGVGIHASGVTSIKDSIARRSTVLGIWADGVAPTPAQTMVTIEGNTSTSRVELGNGIGIQLDGGPHRVKDTAVIGDSIDGLSTDGLVIGPTGTGITLDGVVVKDHGGNGIVVNGTGTAISRSSVDNTVGLDGFVSTGSGTQLNGNDSQAAGHGFVISGPDNVLTSNTAEAAGDGFIVSGDRAALSSNKAIDNAGRGFVLEGVNGTYNSNLAQSNVLDGFVVAGSGNTFINNQSKQNSSGGFNVSGSGNGFKTNAAQSNSGAEWTLAPGNVDNSGNKVNGATFGFTAAGGTFD